MPKFNPLDYPITLSTPARVAPSGWLLHVPFAMFLIDILRPKLLIELGTQHGVSYCAFCQAIKELGTRASAYAVDTWTGDDQAGFYGSEVIENLRQHHDSRYGGFSYLLQMTFEEAVHQFSEESIDLLHIDGCHNYEAVRQDWSLWQPKLSKRGVVLFHDTHLRKSGFEVWKLWEELSAQYPSLDIPYGYGLGVLAVGSDYPVPFGEFITSPENEKRLIYDYFYQLGRRIQMVEDQRVSAEAHTYEVRGYQEQINGYQIQLNTIIEQHRKHLLGLASQHENNINTLTHSLQAQHTHELHMVRRDLDHVTRENKDLLALVRQQQSKISELDLHTKNLEQQFVIAERYAHDLEAQLASIKKTRAWSITQRWYLWKSRFIRRA